MSAFNNLRIFSNSTEMGNIKVSVTVPIYNTATYLRQCLDSLKAQTLKNIEFILVDDGSTDISGVICEEYAKKDSRFRVIHQKNGGLAAARQTGLDNVHGEYVIVCDSDDWAEPDMYEKLYQKAKETNADIVLCGYYSEYGDGRIVPVQTIFKENDGIVDNNDVLYRGVNPSWNKLIRFSLFEQTKATYEPGINLGEDALIMYKLLKGNPRIMQVRERLYHYRRSFGSKSYTNNIRMDNIKQMNYIYEWLKDNYAESNYSILRIEKAINIAFTCMRTSNLDRSYLKVFLKEELQWSRLLANKITLKSFMVVLEKLLPLSLTQKLFKLVYPIFYK